MSDTPPGVFAPKCCHPGCDDWGSWGYGCTREIGSGQWFCYRHRPSDEAPAVQAPPAPPKRIPGGLF